MQACCAIGDCTGHAGAGGGEPPAVMRCNVKEIVEAVVDN